MPAKYQRWVDEDVRWIITADERAAFLRLTANQEWNHFIEQFWSRRNPNPGAPENAFKEEHYRRIAYANVHFPWQAVPGWKTDRGRTYIVLGPPDAIKSEPVHNGFQSSTPTEWWHYRLTSGGARDFKFVDLCGCGDYRLENPASDAP